ncbi:MAG: BBP7 family outer membrane beta-barrel protein [Planctomycetota bacterium]|nr:BBP7 family outer membrane beta-barrel protein [Planctomycetota bacterium]
MKNKLAFAGGLAIFYTLVVTSYQARAAGLYEPSLLAARRTAQSSDPWGGSNIPQLAQHEEIRPEFNSPSADQSPSDAGAPSLSGDCGSGGCSSCDAGGMIDPSTAAWGAAPIGFSGFGNCCGPWYAGVRGLIMNRDRGNNVWLSSSSANGNAQLLTTRDAAMGYSGGFETVIGRYLNQCWAVEAGYWGIFPSTEEANLLYSTATGPLVSRVNFGALSYNNGAGLNQDVGLWYANAQRHRLRMDYQFNNVEVNVLRNTFSWGNGMGGPCAQFQLLAGARYLNVSESLQYSSDYYNTTFGDDPASELDYNVDVDNHLVGFQLGGRYQHMLGCRFMAYAGTKAGIFGNRISHHQDITGGNQIAYLTASGVDDYVIDSSKNDVSFLGEIDLGLGYQISQCWRITGGYRAIGLSGIALATDQIPPFFSYYDAAAQINSSNSMIIHGAYAGIECNF